MRDMARNVFVGLEIVLTISWLTVCAFDFGFFAKNQMIESFRTAFGITVCLLTIILLIGSPFFTKRFRVVAWVGLVMSLISLLLIIVGST